MAEAHSAVAFSFSVTHEGVQVDYDRELLHIIFHSGVRSWRRNFTRFANNIRCGVYPGSLSAMVLSVGTYNGLYLTRQAYNHNIDPSFGLIDVLRKYIKLDEPSQSIVCASLSGVAVWLGVCYALKYSLKGLYQYKGWMYEERGRGAKMSLTSKVWLMTVKLLSQFSSPMLYSFQGSLPSLPVPSVEDTMTRYLRSVRPLLNDEEYARMERHAKEFQGGIGRKLQKYLILKSWWATNYVSDWWEEYVYLRGRAPIMINSNFYGTDAIVVHPTFVQAARAANVTYSAFLFRRLIDRQQLKPIMVSGTVPLCSAQYERTFNTTRVPGIDTDRLVHFGDSMHIVVIHNGRYFKVPCYYKGQLLTPPELQIQFQRILDDDVKPDEGEELMGALTAGERRPWAMAREKFFTTGVNRASLQAIDRAAFVLSLETESQDYNADKGTDLDGFVRTMLHGKGHDRWYDKSFNVIVMANGKIGFNAEHGWADAPILGHMWEFIMVKDLLEMGYDESGNCMGEARVNPLAPVKLRWSLSKECQAVIETSYKVAQALLNDVDLHLIMFDDYGKGFMKKKHLSPDAYIQMALQLAYYRDAGKFNLTYEASMTRLFKEGRTETVRPCTIESAAWVKAMENPKETDATRIELLDKACRRHQRGYQDAMCGKGIDRHLFCLYVISKYLEVDSPFLNEVLSEPWRLSTSQTPHGQTGKLDLTEHPECVSAGGGFGPVADDGYGVSYIIAGENNIFFHVSSKKSSSVTNSKGFARNIRKALNDMKTLLSSTKK
ncbi:carnitine O-palmitoyltransferase 1, liver isoform isoform X1 [Hyalella azteca]|uniref:carnitine O-palmitoyltransferase n=1 Tax=Hyalella azteca TaxID=294128 RepID=A0A8B7N1R5_HYAAZ|nr:carnitine O-palmitoyltransferase 1, liver isoform isoform X1 [Hyalella azteca]